MNRLHYQSLWGFFTLIYNQILKICLKEMVFPLLAIAISYFWQSKCLKVFKDTRPQTVKYIFKFRGALSRKKLKIPFTYSNPLRIECFQ